MRPKVGIETLKQFMRELAAAARGPGKVYFTGGATAVLLGFREQTIDVEKKVEDFLARAEWHDTKAP